METVLWSVGAVLAVLAFSLLVLPGPGVLVIVLAMLVLVSAVTLRLARKTTIRS